MDKEIQEDAYTLEHTEIQAQVLESKFTVSNSIV